MKNPVYRLQISDFEIDEGLVFWSPTLLGEFLRFIVEPKAYEAGVHRFGGKWGVEVVKDSRLYFAGGFNSPLYPRAIRDMLRHYNPRRTYKITAEEAERPGRVKSFALKFREVCPCRS
jgi:hypothetical protein